MKRLVPSSPVVQWLIYATCSLVISGAIAWWLAGGGRERAPAEVAETPAAGRPDCPEPEPEEAPEVESAPAPEAPSDPPDEDSAAPIEAPREPEEALRELTRRRLLIPVEGVDAEDLGDDFDHPRSGGRRHRALDIFAARRTPVLAVEGGRIAGIMTSPRGGLSLFHVDPTETFCYFYAHLDGYAPGLGEGDDVSPGQVLGYVGTTGNAPDHVPHLHFAIHVLPPSKRCLRGTPVNPYDVLRSGLP